MSKTLNEVVLQYLKENGIAQSFLADYISEDRALINKWLRGRYNASPHIIAKIHGFLRESYKSPEKFWKEEKE